MTCPQCGANIINDNCPGCGLSSQSAELIINKRNMPITQVGSSSQSKIKSSYLKIGFLSSIGAGLGCITLVIIIVFGVSWGLSDSDKRTSNTLSHSSDQTFEKPVKNHVGSEGKHTANTNKSENSSSSIQTEPNQRTSEKFDISQIQTLAVNSIVHHENWDSDIKLDGFKLLIVPKDVNGRTATVPIGTKLQIKIFTNISDQPFKILRGPLVYDKTLTANESTNQVFFKVHYNDIDWTLDGDYSECIVAAKLLTPDGNKYEDQTRSLGVNITSENTPKKNTRFTRREEKDYSYQPKSSKPRGPAFSGNKPQSENRANRTTESSSEMETESKICSICDGTGKKDCIFCVNGIHRKFDGEDVTCDHCGGFGYTLCTFCNGTGYRQ